MINNDRIVPITSMDFLSMVGTVINLMAAGNPVAIPSGENGVFTLSEDKASLLNEPAKLINVTVEGGMQSPVYFVADYDWKGFTVGGESIEATGDAIVADGISFYAAFVTSNGITVHKLTPDAPEA